MIDTFKKKVNFLKKKGNIVTFKREILGVDATTIAKLEKSRKSDSVRLHGDFAYVTPWYDHIDKLIDEVDWKFMEKYA